MILLDMINSYRSKHNKTVYAVSYTHLDVYKRQLSVPLSKDTILLSVETSDNICFVNFKANFTDKNSGTAEKEKMTIYSIAVSYTHLDVYKRQKQTCRYYDKKRTFGGS